MDVTLLRIFQEVAHLGSFTAAADVLGYTQSAVSRQISVLEKELGVRLFDRQARGVRPTEEGRCLLPHAEAVTERLRAARGDLRALRDVAAGRLRIGAFATADATLVPHAMRAFRAAHPKVALTLSEGFVHQHLTALRAGDIDLAIVASRAPDDLDGLELRHLLDDPMYVAMHPGHPLAGRDGLRLAELADEDWIAGSPRPEETLLQPVSRPEFRPRIAYVVGEWIAKQGLVAAGLGVTMIPSLAAGAARPDIVLRPLDPADRPPRPVYAATVPGTTAPPAVAAFLDFLDDAVTDLRRRLPATGGDDRPH